MLASRVDQGQVGPFHKVGDAPMAILPHELSLLQPDPEGHLWPNIPGKNLQQGDPDQEGNNPVLGIGMSCSDAGVPCPNIQVLGPSPTDPAGTCLPLPALHDLIPLMSGLATPWVIFTCTPGHQNPKAGHGEVALPCTPKDILPLQRNQWMSVHPKTQ